MKTALITGSTKGIGKAIALDLLNRGYFVYFNGHTQKSIIELDKELFKMHLNNYKIIEADVSGEAYNHILFALNYKKIDVLILNAGMTDRTSFGKIEKESWDKVFNTNLNVPFFLIQALKDKINVGGKIIFISSILSKIPHGTSISYAASKAGINTIVPYLAKEFADKKITVNAVCPGFIENTNWHKNKSKLQIKRIEDKILLKRFGKPKEVSSLVMEVINNPYINGTILDITGGYGL